MSAEIKKEQTKLRKLSKDDLKEILEQHQLFLQSRGKEGGRADLSRHDLSGAYLSGVDLSNAELQGASLNGADLSGADLHQAILEGTNLHDADLSKANLDAEQLSAGQLAGANLTRAKLPQDIQKFELQQIDEASKSTKGIFFIMLLACAYSALTIFSTTDAKLLPNSASSPLPIIQTSVPIAGFFGIAPAIILAIFFYFHIYLQDLWGKLSLLPAVFPDGTPLDQRTFPWLLNGLVQRHLIRLKPYRTPMYRLRVIVSTLLAWWTVPLTIALFWVRYLPRHDWVVTAFNMVFLVVAIVFAAWSQRLARRTLRSHLVDLKSSWKGKLGFTSLLIVTSLLVLSVSDGAIHGQIPNVPGTQSDKAEGSWFGNRYRYLQVESEKLLELKLEYGRRIVPKILPFVFSRAFANVDEQKVSSRPSNWFLRPDDELIRSVQGAQLADVDLRGLSANSAFLVKADLRNANLQGADLWGANLQQANLAGANLQEADVVGANLQEANLKLANLQEADLRGANLQQANLQHAELRKVDLAGANLQEADLYQANLQKANLAGANLRNALMGTANFREANFVGANLQEANLAGTNLRNANLEGTNLKGIQYWRDASIELANLSEVKNAPEGLVEWAEENGAVFLNWIEWAALNEKAPQEEKKN